MRPLTSPLLVHHDDRRHWEEWKRELSETNWRAPASLADTAYKGVVFGWRSLTQLAERYEGERCGFRGHAQKFDLVPKIGRRGARKDRSTGDPVGYSADGEKRILREFELRASPYLGKSPSGKLEWMAIARHHGLPTRLLDWSESFLAAAMFACKASGVGRDADGREAHVNAEICVVRDVLPEIDSRTDPFEIKEVCQYRPAHITPRIPAQRGFFTVHPNPPGAIDHLAERWVICSEACFFIKKMLNLAGINEGTLQPDMDGLGAYLEWCYKWDVKI